MPPILPPPKIPANHVIPTYALLKYRPLKIRKRKVEFYTHTLHILKDQLLFRRRLISANPFWSDGEEPSSDEETNDTR